MLIIMPVAVIWSVLTALSSPGPGKETLDNWHQWRGPLATGASPHGDPPLKWDRQTNIKWKTAQARLG